MAAATRFWLTALMLAALVGGCKSTEDAPDATQKPLAHDPTDEGELGAWWTNDQQLLYLGDDGHFALFATDSRYRPASERGRWSRQSYAVLILEPYEERRTESIRAGIDRVDGQLALRVRDLAPMRSVDHPPIQPEDELIGGWEGDAGRLWLNVVGSYTFSPSGPAAFVAGHQGQWELVGAEVVCRPYPQSIEPFVLERRLDQGLSLANASARFERRRTIPGD